MDNSLSQAQLRDVLEYNPETGVFRWLKTVAQRIKIGDIAGTSIQGYTIIKINNKQYCAHRLVWLYVYGVWPKKQIDHENHIRSDNRMANLREATHQENGRNRSLNINSTSGVCGVCWGNRESKWLAQIKVNKRDIYLGYFADKFEAICARKSAERKHGFHLNHGMKANKALVEVLK